MKKRNKFEIPNFKFPLFKIYCPKNIGNKIEKAMKNGEVTEGRFSEDLEKNFQKLLI